MTEKDHAERLASVETEIKNMYIVLTRLEGKIDTWQSNYVPRNEINESNKGRDERIIKLEDSQRWVWRTIATGVFTFTVSMLLIFIEIYLKR